MKIAHVVDSMEVGGAETLVLQMCRLQREQGHDPCVYAVAALGALGEQMRQEGFVVQANVGKHMSDATRSFFGIFKKSRPDVVHLHNPTPTIYAAISARMAGVPSIVSTRHSLVAPPHNAIMELKYGLAARCCDWVVGICDATTNNIKRVRNVPARKLIRVYNGALPLTLAPSDRLLPKSGFTLIDVGRLAQVKNHALLLDAFRAALSSMPSLRLWMGSKKSDWIPQRSNMCWSRMVMVTMIRAPSFCRTATAPRSPSAMRIGSWWTRRSPSPGASRARISR